MKQDKKHALVTGATKGIGKSIAELLIQEGYHVYGTSRNPETIEDKLSEIEYLQLDLTDESSITNLVESIDKIDVLINNAGISQIGPVEEVNMQEMVNLFNLNFFGTVQLTKSLLPKMREQKSGVIINITSFASRTPVPYSSIYAASKGAMESFSSGLRNEVWKYGIKVVTVAPTFIKTEIYQEQICSKESVYFKDFIKVKEIRDNNIDKGSLPSVVAKKILNIINKKNPNSFYAVGSNASLLNFLYRFSPNLLGKLTRKRFNI